MYTRSLFKKKFVRDTAWNLGGVIMLAASGVAINVLIGNFLDISSLGIFNYVYSVYIVVAAFTEFGLTSSLIKFSAEHSKERQELNTIYTSGIIIVSAISIISLLALILLSGSIFERSAVEPRFIRLALISVPLYSVNQLILSGLNGLRKMREFSIIRSLRWLIIVIFISLAILMGTGIETILLCFLTAETVVLVVLLTVSRKYYKFSISGNIKSWINAHLNYGFKVTLSQIVNQVDNKLSLLIMGFLLSKSEVGMYSFAFTIANGLLMVPMAISINFNPLISNMWESRKNDLRNYVEKVKKATSLVVIMITLISCLAYPLFIHIFMKSAPVYVKTIPLFYILLAGNIAFGSIKWASGFLPMIGEPEKYLTIRTATLFINVVLSITLIKYYGLIGAAVATAMSNIVFSGALSYYVNKRLKMS